jgi:FHA domain
MQEHGATTVEYAAAAIAEAEAEWLEEARAALAPGARRLACRDDAGEVLVFSVKPGWTRIGRSVAADIRLDDPSVSRRHALVVSEAEESLRVLDDRSLNGVFVNGELAEWGKLADGDELTVGRYHLFVLEG